MKTATLNHIYRLIWSHVHHAWIAVAEIATSQGNSSSAVKADAQNASTQSTSLLDVSFKTSAKVSLALSCAFQLFYQQAYALDANALPTGAQSVYGNSNISVNGSTMSINQTTQNAVVNWQTFNIGSGAAVNLSQPNAASALYRVVGNDASQIYGQLNATGQLFLINPNGVLFGRGAQVNVGSLVASSLGMSNEDYLSGTFKFSASSVFGNVINQGNIQTSNEGYVVFLGNTVDNAGSITANNGSVSLASGKEAVLDFYGNGLVKTKLTGEALNAVVNNSGNISATGGAVQMATNARVSAINVSGIVEANSMVERNGVIRLEGGDNARVSVSGTLSAQGLATGAKGGNISVTGEQVALFAGANLDASGQAGGGTVLVGGDLQGKNADVYNARTTYVDKNASIKVDATQQGNAGKAIVWANDIARFYGNISAKGGAVAGNGGFVEVSGKLNLDFIGKVDLSAINGVGGQFLLDPINIILNTTTQSSPANNTNGTADIAFGDSANNIPSTGTTTVQIADIIGFSEAFFQASNDITIASTLSMGINNSIRLEAGNNINVNAALNTSGTGNINLKADADNTGVGNLAIGANITSRAGGINLSGATITRTAGNIASSGATNSDAGNITITSTGSTNLGIATISANGGVASAGNSGRNAGNITINVASYTGTGAISATGSTSSGANTSGGNAGNISITSSNGIAMGSATITANSGNAGATGNGSSGNAGAISITNNTTGNITTGAINSRVGIAIGAGTGGAAGSVLVTNNAPAGSITTGAITTAGQNNSNANGGAIQLISTGNINAGAISSSGGTVRTGNTGKNAGSVTIHSGGNVVTGAITSAGSAGLGTNQNGGAGGTVNLTAGTGNTITHTSITTSGGARTGSGVGGNGGNITINGNSVLSANTSITASVGTGGLASGTVNFAGTINSSGVNRTLAINTTAATTLNGAIGNTLALTSLTTNTGGTTTINGGSVTTTGAQSYGDAVTTSSATTFATTNSNVTFSSSIVAAGNTIISAGTGTVTATSASNNFNQLSLTAGSANIRDANAIALGSSNVLGNLSLQTAGAITQTGALTVGGITTLNASTAGDITLNNINNNFNAVAVSSGRDVQLSDANALTINASNLRTIDARALGGNLTLGGNVVATGGTPVTSISLSTNQNFLNTGNFSLTPGAGKRWLVYSTNEVNDTRGALLSTAYDFKQYNTVIGGTILGANDGFIYSIAPVITAKLTGTSNKVYDATTNAPISALVLTQTGAINSDNVLLGGLTSASYDNKNVGSNLLVTSNNGIQIATATSADGKQVFGYQLANTSVSANIGQITPANITSVTGITANDTGLLAGDNQKIVNPFAFGAGSQSLRDLAGVNISNAYLSNIGSANIVEVGLTSAGNLTGLVDSFYQFADNENIANKEVAYVLNFGLRLPSLNTIQLGEAEEEE
jgi:filamentous hemagglutinin family protein